MLPEMTDTGPDAPEICETPDATMILPELEFVELPELRMTEPELPFWAKPEANTKRPELPSEVPVLSKIIPDAPETTEFPDRITTAPLALF